jgi:hypothetical protein
VKHQTLTREDHPFKVPIGNIRDADNLYLARGIHVATKEFAGTICSRYGSFEISHHSEPLVKERSALLPLISTSLKY